MLAAYFLLAASGVQLWRGRPALIRLALGLLLMGAAIEVFAGATAIAVPRSRFQPVKTTNELLLLRSDVFSLGEDAIRTEAEKYLMMGALNLVECVAFVGEDKPRR